MTEPRIEYVDVDGARLAFRRWGSGPPLYLLHGGPGASGAYWPAAVAYLGEDYEVFALDFRGHGLSSRTPPYGIRRFAEDVVLFADALGHDAFSLMGHSYGALVSFEAAARTSACRELVAIGGFGSSARMIVTPSGFLAKLHMAAALVTWNLRRWILRDGDPAVFLKAMMERGVPLFHGRPDPLPHVDEALWASALPPLEPLIPLQWDLLFWSGRRALPRISARTLVITGERDAIGAPEVRRIARVIPNAEHALIPDAGHSPFLEDPAVFREHVTAFLRTA